MVVCFTFFAILDCSHDNWFCIPILHTKNTVLRTLWRSRYPGFWNEVDWRALVKNLSPQIARHNEYQFKRKILGKIYFWEFKYIKRKYSIILSGNIFKTLSLQNGKSLWADIFKEYSPTTMCYMWHFKCHISHVTYHMLQITCNCWACPWRVCYQQGLPYLVFSPSFSPN